MKEQILVTTVRDSMVEVKKNNAAVREKNGVAVGEGGNHPSTTAPARPSNCAPIRLQIFNFGFLFRLFPFSLACCVGFVALGWSVLLHTVRLVINKAKHCAPLLLCPIKLT